MGARRRPVATAKRAARAATANRRRSRSNAAWNPKASRAATPPSASVPCNAPRGERVASVALSQRRVPGNQKTRRLSSSRAARGAERRDRVPPLARRLRPQARATANPAARPQATPSRTSRRAEECRRNAVRSFHKRQKWRSAAKAPVSSAIAWHESLASHHAYASETARGDARRPVAGEGFPLKTTAATLGGSTRSGP